MPVTLNHLLCYYDINHRGNLADKSEIRMLKLLLHSKRVLCRPAFSGVTSPPVRILPRLQLTPSRQTRPTTPNWTNAHLLMPDACTRSMHVVRASLSVGPLRLSSSYARRARNGQRRRAPRPSPARGPRPDQSILYQTMPLVASAHGRCHAQAQPLVAARF
jgi:hypothetical protein